ncbi:hypothetical protein KRR39_20405 [Nocardioides panacis]|uniref:site-specific DNA-methyltransferase (adenine-specific) n=1 Tax=Nocardioides panacis TaxID=2849501 RepID=A0A975SXG8_9ACTN|nr:hypothetical protein [Nocardioides panacis]QWZ07727.1 hypothetical protein KRR39_20405 [Nocardioides panacis]
MASSEHPPALLAENIPDDAFTPVHGDDQPCDICSAAGSAKCNHKWSSIVRKHNQSERQNAGEQTLFGVHGVRIDNAALAAALDDIEHQNADDIASVRAKADAWRRLDNSTELRRARTVADAWCAAFMWTLNRDAIQPITHEGLLALQGDPDLVPLAAQREVVARLARKYRFFHWHLEFPQIFRATGGAEAGTQGWSGGFSLVLGNPPWDRVKVQEPEFFNAAGRPDIAKATGAKRRKMIEALSAEDPPLFDAYSAALQEAEATACFLRNSGRFPLAGVGRDINTSSIFVESSSQLIAPTGRLGQVVPSGIATDDTTKNLFAELSDGRLVTLLDFDNRKGIFPAVHSATKFCVLIAKGTRDRMAKARFAFFLQEPKEAKDPSRWIPMSASDIALINPNTRTCPIFRTVRHGEIALDVYRRHAVLSGPEATREPNGWAFTTRPGLFHMGNDSALFTEDADAPGNVRLYEAKMAHAYDHRWANLAGVSEAPNRSDPKDLAQPRHWVSQREVKRRIGAEVPFLTGVRDVTNSTNERTLIPLVLPPEGVGHNITLFQVRTHALSLVACFASLACDFMSRVKLGGTHMSAFVLRQLPIPSPQTFDEPCPWDSQLTLAEWIRPRVLELLWTAEDLNGLAMSENLSGQPYVWDSERRRTLRAELDAAFMHLYGLRRDEVDFVLDDFPIVRKAEEKQYGRFALKELILNLYEDMARASASGQPLKSSLTPPPGGGPQN